MRKITKAHQLITQALNKKNKKIELRELQKLTGFLNFLCRAIVPGRTFTRRLYAKTEGILKSHHHIYIDAEMRADLETWLEFLKNPNIYARNFADFDQQHTSKDIDMYTDATANKNLGCGGFSETNWFACQWGEKFIEDNNPSINYLELYGVTVAIFNWIHKYSNMKITLFCDNMSVVHMINNTTSKCKNCMKLIRLIILKGMKHNVKINAKHVAGKSNRYSDLSE